MLHLTEKNTFYFEQDCDCLHKKLKISQTIMTFMQTVSFSPSIQLKITVHS